MCRMVALLIALCVSLSSELSAQSVAVVDGNSDILRALERLRISAQLIAADKVNRGELGGIDLIITGAQARIRGSAALRDSIEKGLVLLSLTDGIDWRWSWLPTGYELKQGDYNALIRTARDLNHPIFNEPNKLGADCLARVSPAALHSCHSPGPNWQVLADAELQYSPWPDRPPLPLAVILEATLGKGAIVVVQTRSIQRQWVRVDKLSEHSPAGRLFQNLVEYARRRACRARGKKFVPSIFRFPPVLNFRKGWIPVRLPGYFDPGPYMDFSADVERPAGKHGFVSAKAGKLVFPNGHPLKLWSYEVQILSVTDHKKLDRYLDRLASLGANCIRFYPITHSMRIADFRRVLRNYDTRSVEFDPQRLDAFDYFFAGAKARGIYFFLTIEAGLYCNKYLEPEAEAFNWTLQRRFFEHRNPYTGLRYKDDPAIAIVEISNETQFRRWDMLRRMPEKVYKRFHQMLKRRWNAWLRRRYHNFAGLKEAWTDYRGRSPLRNGQTLQFGTIPLDLKAYSRAFWTSWNRPYDNLQSCPAVYNDMNVFLQGLMRDYFDRTKQKLRRLGVKCVISYQEDIGTCAYLRGSELNFTGGYRSGIRPDGTFYQGSMLLSANMACRPYNIVPNLNESASGIYEWNDGWPNTFRAESGFVHAAYGSLQGFDILSMHLILVENSVFRAMGKHALGYYLLPDPAKAFTYPLAGLIYRRGDFKEAPTTVCVFASPTDQFYFHAVEPHNYAFRYLTNMVRVSVALGKDSTYRGEVPVVINSGFSADADLRAARHAIVIGYNLNADLHNHIAAVQQPAQLLYPKLIFATPSRRFVLTFERVGWDRKVLSDCPLKPGIRLDTLPPGAIPIGVNRPANLCLGFLNEKHLIVPGAPAVDARHPKELLLYRLYLDALNHWGLFPNNHRLADRHEIVSADGTIRRDFGSGLLVLDSPRTQGALGLFKNLPAGRQSIRLRDCEIACPMDYANIVITSLDGRPIAESSNLLITATARVENTGQRAVPQASKPGKSAALWTDTLPDVDNVRMVLLEEGTAPALFEPVTADVNLKVKAAALRLIPLDPETGHPRSRITLSPNERGGFVLKLRPEYRTVWYEVKVLR